MIFSHASCLNQCPVAIPGLAGSDRFGGLGRLRASMLLMALAGSTQGLCNGSKASGSMNTYRVEQLQELESVGFSLKALWCLGFRVEGEG